MVLCVWQFGELSVPFFFNASKYVYPYAGVRVSVRVVCEFVAASFCLCACAGIYLHVGLSMWLCDGVCMYLLLLMWVCVWVYMCVSCLGVGGWGVSLVSLLNIKQLEVIKYLGSAGSLWILILPFPSVSQISLSFPLLSVSLFFPSSFSPRPSPYTHVIPVFIPVCGYPLTFSFFGPYSCMISPPPVSSSFDRVYEGVTVT